MFRKLREKIEQALARREAERPISRDELDDLLGRMREEVIQLRARIPKLEKQVARIDTQVQEQIRRAERAHKAAQEAQAAGRADEASRAMEATQRALKQAEDLKQQAAEAHADLADMRADAAEKLEALKEAKRSKSVLLARSRRAGTARRLEEALHGPESGLRRFERAEEDLETAEDLAAAADEVDELLGGGKAVEEADYELRQLEAAEEMDDVERRLAQLKREVEEETR